jgi:hypothetical protein
MNCLICKSNKNVNFIDKYKFEVIEDKKYLLESISLSPFLGGSGRYREFFLKKNDKK